MVYDDHLYHNLMAITHLAQEKGEPICTKICFPDLFERKSYDIDILGKMTRLQLLEIESALHDFHEVLLEGARGPEQRRRDMWINNLSNFSVKAAAVPKR